MAYPNRELSQFASFLKINDVDKKIAITDGVTPFVGIGSTIPQEKLDVLGNIKISGDINARRYYGDGSTLTGVAGVISGNFLTNSGGSYTTSNVGIGTSVISNTLSVGGDLGVKSTITAYSINLTAEPGVAPITVQSNTLISNLNADLIRGRVPPEGSFVGTTDVQNLFNKTLSNPGISTIINGSAVLNVPTTSGTLIHTNAVGLLTSGVYGTGSINNTHISASAGINYSKLNLNNSIVNSDISVGAGITYGKLSLSNSIKSSDIDSNNPIANNKLANNTISGVTLGSNLFSLSPGSYITGNPFNGSTAGIWGVNARSDNTAASIVARDSIGQFSASYINLESNNPFVKFTDTNSIVDYWAYVDSNNFYILADRDSNGVVDSPNPLILNAVTNIGYVFDNEIITSGTNQVISGIKTFNSTLSGNINGNASTVTNGVYTTGNQTIGGIKTFNSTISGSIDGNASTVTNGVYTTGNQTIGGIKTFNNSANFQSNIKVIGITTIDNNLFVKNVNGQNSVFEKTLEIRDPGDVGFSSIGNNLILTNSTPNIPPTAPDAPPVRWLFRTFNPNLGRHLELALEGVSTWTALYRFGSDGTFTQLVSDIRLKTNIIPIENALEKIDSLTGFTYEFNKTALELGFKNEKRRVGVSANDVQKVQPEAVHPSPASDKYLTVNYEHLVPLLIEGIKELKKENEKLKTALSQAGIV